MTPIVRAVERTLDGSLSPYMHVASLDFTNAFHSLALRDVAEALGKYAKFLYRASRWAHSAESDLVVGDLRLTLSCGVRQGDPTQRPPLLPRYTPNSLCAAEALGPSRQILATSTTFSSSRSTPLPSMVLSPSLALASLQAQ